MKSGRGGGGGGAVRFRPDTKSEGGKGLVLRGRGGHDSCGEGGEVMTSVEREGLMFMNKLTKDILNNTYTKFITG